MTDRGKLQALTGALLRIISGAMFALHGTQKLLNFPPSSHGQPEMFTQIWIGGVIELVCGVLIAIGLFTRLAALLASGTMAVAYFQFHWGIHKAGAMADLKFLPIVNAGELAVVYCFLFLVYAVSGAGPYSIDASRGRS